ncbi:MAG TPA: hypothetical protein VHR45_25460 [Thermoanaerobaculia bacterium]|nr:hypothetical protein [Thermoanaerobaculia bacterium]
MRSMGVASTFALLVLSFTTAHLASAQPAARGSYWFLLEDGLPKFVDFYASTDARGTTTGQMTFTDQARIPDVDDAEDPGAGDAPPQFYVSASFDGLKVDSVYSLVDLLRWEGRIVVHP